MVHVRRLPDGRSLRFGHRGWLWHNAYLLYDRETDSIWHHQTGWAMAGPLRGASLQRFPTVQATFGAWRDEHPDTLVLPKPKDDPRPLDRDTYASRNAGLAFGLGIDLPDGWRLYPFADVVAAGGVVADVQGGLPLVVALDPAGRGAYAYERRVDGAVVHLTADTGAAGGPLLRERHGTRAWRLRSGRPVAGSGARIALRPLLSSPWETSAWHLQHPDGTVWSPPREDGGVPDEGR